MKILLDTHVIIWVLTDDPRLSDKARELVCSPENILYYSVASLWEIAVKNLKSPQKCPYHETDVMEYCREAGYLSLDIQAHHIQGVRTLKLREGRYLANMDPFDRLLISQAKTEGCLILSHDTCFDNYDEKCILHI